jgi:galactokinase
MAIALKNVDEATIGRLMQTSHESLRNDYEVSCPELDIMVSAAAEHPATIGARMTGGGFGGCTVNLVHQGSAPDFIEHVSSMYRKATGIAPDIFASGTADGAGEWTKG